MQKKIQHYQEIDPSEVDQLTAATTLALQRMQLYQEDATEAVTLTKPARKDSPKTKKTFDHASSMCCHISNVWLQFHTSFIYFFPINSLFHVQSTGMGSTQFPGEEGSLQCDQVMEHLSRRQTYDTTFF